MDKRLIGRLLSKLSFPAICIIFITSFYFSVVNLPAIASMYPIALIVIIAVILIITLLLETKNLFTEEDEGKKYESFKQWWDEWKKTIYTIVVLFLYIFLIDKLGFFSSTTLFLATLIWSLGYRKIIPIILIISITVIGAYLIFTEVFRVPLPRGIFM